MEIKREKFRACFNIGGGKDGVSKKTQKRDKTGATLQLKPGLRYDKRPSENLFFNKVAWVETQHPHKPPMLGLQPKLPAAVKP